MKKSKILITISFIFCGFVIFSKIYTYPDAVSELKWYHSAIRHAKAGLMFINFIPHDECIYKIHPFGFDELKFKANLLNEMGYLRPPLVKTNIMQDIEAQPAKGEDYGSLDATIQLDNTLFLAGGTAFNPRKNRPVDAVLLTYDDKQGKSRLLTLYNGNDVKWNKKYFIYKIPTDTVVLRAWAYDLEKSCVYKLRGTILIDKKTKIFTRVP